ncbi:hypothetical protein FRX31_017847 [Thalictrum thalictroides]|uniref:Uncharacterized protein n=1 Tax=Thalictrum thalictroides TaxID=46969 RepID=A0A7J6W5T7_THATH|nr:hypothetical protein FRX31_017847 [Thalictrum thalictroides]
MTEVNKEAVDQVKAKQPICPWSFFDGLDVGQVSNKEASEPKVRKNFSLAEMMKGDRVNPIDVSQLPIPGKKGNFPSIKLPKRVVERGIEYCKFSLVGRLDLQSLKIERVREIASKLWTLCR